MKTILILALIAVTSAVSAFTLDVKIQMSNDGVTWTDTGYESVRLYPTGNTNSLFFRAFTYIPAGAPTPPPNKKYVSYTVLSGTNVNSVTNYYDGIGFVLLNSANFYRPDFKILP